MFRNRNPFDLTIAPQARNVFIDVVFNIMRVCCLTQYDQQIVVETNAIQTYVYNTIKNGGANAATTEEVITCLVLMAILGIDLEENNLIKTILTDHFVIFPMLSNACKAVWVGTDYRKNTRLATMTAVLSGAGALMNNVSYTSQGIEFELTTHANKLKLCFVKISEVMLRSLYGVNHFPCKREQLIVHLETRQLPCSSTISKFFIGMMVDIPNYIGKREVTMSLTSFAVWILQFAVLMAGVMLLEVIDEPFMPRAMQKIMSWL